MTDSEPSPEPAGVSGMSVAALVLGAGALLLVFIAARLFVPFALVLALAAVVLGVVGGRAADRAGLSGVWLARVGIILGLAAGALGIWWLTT